MVESGDARVVLDLCGGTGSWSKPYRDAGYKVLVVDADPKVQPDVRANIQGFQPPPRVHGILAAPPCTEFASSGARWWRDKHPATLRKALEIVLACLRIIRQARPSWWCLENPVGRLPRFIGPYKMTFQPWEYGDPWTKRTCLWGDFVVPARNPVEPTEGGKLWRLPPSPRRARLRSVTPPGFAKAFFEANP